MKQAQTYMQYVGGKLAALAEPVMGDPEIGSKEDLLLLQDNAVAERAFLLILDFGARLASRIETLGHSGVRVPDELISSIFKSARFLLLALENKARVGEEDLFWETRKFRY